jgi:hypothetical protein
MSSSTRWSRADRAASATLLAATLALAVPPPAVALMQAAALTPTASSLPEHVLRHLDEARPLGAGRLTWFGLHIYDAQLFVARGFDPSRPEAQPLALELTYARRLSGHAIAERSYDEIARLALGTGAQRSRWLADMKTLFPDVKSGQRLAGIYRPNAATRFYLDGRFVGEVADPEFGRAFFAIWLDPRTSAPQLRTSLLRASS